MLVAQCSLCSSGPSWGRCMLMGLDAQAYAFLVSALHKALSSFQALPCWVTCIFGLP